MTIEKQIKQAAREYTARQGDILSEKVANAFIAGANFGREIGMKTLSVKQPWAYLLCAGVKDIENRTWKLPEKYKGERVLIHASADRKLDYGILTRKQYNGMLDNVSFKETEFPFNDKLNRSAIIGSVRFVDCIINHPSIWAEKTSFSRSVILNNDLTVKGYRVKEEKPIYNWVVADPIMFDKPILNVNGKLSFWDYDLPEEYETILNKALGL